MGKEGYKQIDKKDMYPFTPIQSGISKWWDELTIDNYWGEITEIDKDRKVLWFKVVDGYIWIYYEENDGN